MSEDPTQPGQNPPRPQGMPARVSFLVTCDVEKGEVEIRGPIQQKLFAIKVLADAIRIVTDHVVKPPPVIVDPRKNGGLTLPS